MSGDFLSIKFDYEVARPSMEDIERARKAIKRRFQKKELTFQEFYRQLTLLYQEYLSRKHVIESESSKDTH